MKKYLFSTLAILLIGSSCSFGQIQYESTDFITVGDSIVRAQDTSGTFSAGMTGTAQIWDFSLMTEHEVDTTYIVTPASTPYGGDFAGSNMAMTSDNVAFAYFSTNASEMITDGAAGDLLGVGAILTAKLNPPSKILHFPTVYEGAFWDNSGFEITVSGSLVGQPAIPQVRLNQGVVTYDTVDAWGTLMHPNGESYSVLRVQRTNYTTDTISAAFITFPTPIWTQISITKDTNVSYAWLAKESGLAMAELTYDSTGNPDDLTMTRMMAPPTASFTYQENGQGNVDFSSTSTNSPNNWFWDFGDGGTSADENPNHIYLANGTYSVCLIVSNSAGADTSCSVVTISDIPAPPVASFTFIDNGMGYFDFTSTSSPEIANWLWDFGDGNSSTDSVSSHLYMANGSYTVCLTVSNVSGSDSTCQTITISDIVIAPVAGFTSQDNGSGDFTFSDDSQNEPTSWAWSFGDGTISTDTSPNHVYAANGDYEVCLVVMNTAGMDSTCQTVTVSGIVGMESDLKNGLNWMIFPNPASANVTLISPLHFNETPIVDIVDLTGKTVFSAPVHNGKMDISMLQNGLYFYLIRTENERVLKTGKLLVE